MKTQTLWYAAETLFLIIKPFLGVLVTVIPIILYLAGLFALMQDTFLAVLLWCLVGGPIYLLVQNFWTRKVRQWWGVTREASTPKERKLMKTIRTHLQRAGSIALAILATIVAFIPTGILAILWLVIPRMTLAGKLGLAICLAAWLFGQVIWALKVAVWWDNLRKDPLPVIPSGKDDGDLDISF